MPMAFIWVCLEDERLAALVLIGARPDGTEEELALEDGYRESKESWLLLPRDLKEAMNAPSKKVCERALDATMKAYGAKCPKLAKCLNAEREALLTHVDFP